YIIKKVDLLDHIYTLPILFKGNIKYTKAISTLNKHRIKIRIQLKKSGSTCYTLSTIPGLPEINRFQGGDASSLVFCKIMGNANII
ncbi:hypothetical protein ET345_25970, partial [Salmonella enterica]|nr:hypothetical protein [Salmonella enterica]